MNTLRVVTLLAVTLVLTSGWTNAAPPRQQAEERYFPQTGFAVSDDEFWDYFSHRGGVRTFGYPVSRVFVLEGFQVQIFQRRILQRAPEGPVHSANMLDPGLMPYTRINGSVYPASDPALIAAAPNPTQSNYDTRMVAFVEAQAPDTWNGLQVNFAATFFRTVTCDDVFPEGDCAENLLPLLNLELWGAPLSEPAFDPTNRDFVYQRFQRGIMHYDRGCNCTQGLLLADYFKGILTGENLPDDLDAAARGSSYYRQYSPAGANWVARAPEIPNSDLTNAFVAESGPTRPQQSPATTDDYYRAASAEYGMVVHVFGQETAARDFALVHDAGFTWVKIQMPWRVMEPQHQVYDWTEADRVVELAQEHDLKVIARLDGTPAWARADGGNHGATDGPPDNYQDYADFLSAFVGHFKRDSKRVQAVEIWNEPNIAREWGNQSPNAAQYVDMLKLAYVSAKLASPKITVLTGALTPTGTWDASSTPDDVFLQEMYNAGARGYFDVIATHAAGYKAAPETSPDEVAADPTLGGHRFFSFRHVEDIRAIMVANGDEAKQIWVTEFGWTSDPIHPEYAWHAVPEETKGEYLVRAFQWANGNWSPWIGVMTAWTLAAPYWEDSNEQYWWAITNPDGTTRPAYDRLKLARFPLDPAALPELPINPVPIQPADMPPVVPGEEPPAEVPAEVPADAPAP